MRSSDVEALVGAPYPELARRKGFEVVCFLGDEVESLGSRRTIEDALMLLRARVIPENGDDAWLDGLEEDAAVQDPELRPMAIALSEACSMERITRPEKLVYLAPVLEERPDLRLVVAWEAAPPLQDAAFGLFEDA